MNWSCDEIEGFESLALAAWDDREEMVSFAEFCEFLFFEGLGVILLAAVLHWKDDKEVVGKLMTALANSVPEQMFLVDKVLEKFDVVIGRNENTLLYVHGDDVKYRYDRMGMLQDLSLPDKRVAEILWETKSDGGCWELTTLLCRAVLKSEVGDDARVCAEMKVFYELAPKQKFFADYVIGLNK